jgi:hypothetical protein
MLLVCCLNHFCNQLQYRLQLLLKIQVMNIDMDKDGDSFGLIKELPFLPLDLNKTLNTSANIENG